MRRMATGNCPNPSYYKHNIDKFNPFAVYRLNAIYAVIAYSPVQTIFGVASAQFHSK
jgi:hypothetical protein